MHERKYVCVGCGNEFIGTRSSKWVNAIICPKCKTGVNVVEYTHPFVKLFDKQRGDKK